MDPLDYGRFDALTFDCYGTLIDWEAGILGRPAPVLGTARGRAARRRAARGRSPGSRRPPRPARTCATGRSWPLPARRRRAATASTPSDAEAATFADSVGDWPAFADSAAALRRLQTRFRLGVITNCDDDLFARSAARLGVDFDWVVTAQSVGVYKPDQRNFDGRARADRAPARADPARRPEPVPRPCDRPGARLPTVWIDRRHDRPGSGATPPADATSRCDVPRHGLVRGGRHAAA